MSIPPALHGGLLLGLPLLLPLFLELLLDFESDLVPVDLNLVHVGLVLRVGLLLLAPCQMLHPRVVVGTVQMNIQNIWKETPKGKVVSQFKHLIFI